MNGPNSQKVKSIFSDVAKTYDKANNAMTFGLAHLWRKKVVRLSELNSKESAVLDCATGTGDLALEFKKHYGNSVKVTGIDFCDDMLKYAPLKAKKKSLDITFELGDILNLKYSDKSFDAVTVAYGIRNVEDTLGGLKEMWRVIKPGGKLIVLETGEGTGILNFPVNFYTKHIVPLVGGLISKKKEAYSYLSKSSQNFPSKGNFLNLAKNFSDLKTSKFISLMFGASYIYIFEKEEINQ